MLSLKRSRSDIFFDICNFCILTTALILVIYPLYFVIIASVSDPNALYDGRVLFLPEQLTLEGYKKILEEISIWTGYKNTIIYTVSGTFINLLVTLPGAYGLSRSDLKGRKIFMFIITFTMFFSGGLIPSYLLVRSLGMYDTIWALVIPNAVVVWNLFVARAFFQTTIPKELLEAAQQDGCTDFKFFLRVVLPLSRALTVIMILFYGVHHWNAFFNALIYLRDESKYPLQLALRKLLIMNEASSDITSSADTVSERQRILELMRYGTILVASLPLILVYPYMQKFFVKGVMIGSIKG